jgi:hypothetical protein
VKILRRVTGELLLELLRMTKDGRQAHDDFCDAFCYGLMRAFGVTARGKARKLLFQRAW